MSSADNRRSPLYRQLEAYEEAWKRDHDEAMACRDCEDAIAVGINIFQVLRDREEAWRDQVFRGATAYTDEDNLDHRQRLSNWLDTTRVVLATTLPLLESRFGTVEGAAEFRRCFQQAEAVFQGWQPPRLSAAVGLREMTLSPEAAAELQRLAADARRTPPSMPARGMEQKDASFLKRSS